jgi:hypoxia up-regulated 1
MRINKSLTLVGITALATLLDLVAAAAVIGIDYGQDWYKVALVKPGFPLDLVLNRDSKRKTASALTLRHGERQYGSDALASAARFPSNTFLDLKQLFGRSYDDDVCVNYRKLHATHMITLPGHNTVAFQINDSDTEGKPFPVEELVAMQLAEAKRQAELTAGEAVRDCVIAVPSYYTQVERQAVLDAANLAGLRVIELINDGTAVALNYAMSRTFKPEPEYHLVFDMGAASTTVTIASYRTISVKDVGSYLKDVPQVQIHALAYDRHLGGGEMDLRLRDYLADQFTASTKGLERPIRENPRAMARLLREANRVKQILSANNDTYASVESLHEDHDFRIRVERATLESLIADMRPRIKATIELALTRAGISADNIQSAMLMGGSARVPYVQSILKDIIGPRIAQTVNGDEAIVVGAAFRGAGSLRQLRVKEILIKDMVHYPIQVTYQSEGATSASETASEHKTLLFKRGAASDVEKSLTFHRTTDFEFEVKYLPEEGDE